ncbi:NAD+ synthase [Candidatus Hakubella thermalkaliphila]|uniref:NH(3)-dependent NAD(+) synthetase n=3 Tax=Candidatus Hakubella thermalkaliphila TaxID=2754717 RepID=A0A6V8P8X7_9ACTN|nr:NAD+ synthase [Candidatus Hakubella thermalkaliphila]GFP18774.1 NAD+ synthase [Candidatus Hakubella thermalkaliphila]GFP29099.1 NAD+ synthase [Candidatus Hakubella thermalkaliphila]GFP38365.1 NAD+ synthase [Candidatus Hakubella thermalkaliphila]GFP41666.1 NAD+ synthase [Candidatus Hakubella thermalkaliphila]
MLDLKVEVDLTVNTDLVKQILTDFVRSETHRVGFDRVVVGLSGGVDSSLSTFVAVEALSKENVVALIMPYKTSRKESTDDARMVVELLGIDSKVIDITPMVDVYFAMLPETDERRRGNKMARERMSILYDHSAALGALVLGTSNKTELLLGYGTVYGDMASAINPLGDLYKTQIRQVARAFGVPEKIVAKAPTADLWMDQTDEKELGFTYEDVDKLLYLMVDKRYDRESLVEVGFQKEFVNRVYQMVQRSHYKRRPPLIAKLSGRTIDREFRYSRDWGV